MTKREKVTASDVLAEKDPARQAEVIKAYLKPAGKETDVREIASKAISTTSGAVATVGGAKAATAAAVTSTHLYGGAAVMKGLATAGALVGGGAATGVIAISLVAATTGFLTYSIVRAITRK